MSKVKDKSLVDCSEIQLREIFTQAGLNSNLTERAIKDYQKYRNSKSSSQSILSYKDLESLREEAFIDKIFKPKDKIGIVESILRDYLKYLKYKNQIAETYQENKDWVHVFSTSVYSDVYEAQEAFIDFIEETLQIKIKDAKHLQELTGITHLDSWDSKAGKYIAPDTEEEAKENAIRELEETVINSRFNKYFRALEIALQEGAKYKDLLQIKPQDYGLPKDFKRKNAVGKDQYNSILYAISFDFMIMEMYGGSMILPDLRSIAQELEAPYSVLMDCYNLNP